MKNFKGITAVILFLFSSQIFAWNSVGHRMVVQIAYDQMTPEAKKKYNMINHALDKVYPSKSLVNAAVWLDSIRYEGEVSWYDSMHYVNLYFSTDGTPLPSLQKVNAVWAIDHAIKSLESNKTTDFDKGIALRILIHVLGDLHQPMHGVAKVSQAYPNGDLGGNLFYLGHNSVSNNLHGYWDNGAGLFKSKKYLKQNQIAKRASVLEKHHPCRQENISTLPADWLSESHHIATTFAYNLTPKQKPDIHYQKEAQNIVKQRVALAGCRLALLLNHMAEKQQ